MKSKPAKYGIKLWSCVDVDTKFLLNVDIYLGKNNTDAKKNKEVGKNVVLNLTRNYNGTGRIVTCDNFFTSIPLANELWENGFKMVGTLRANKKDIPTEFRPNKYREVFSSIHGFCKNLTLVSYVPKPKRSVILLSTEHHLDLCDEKNNKKPEIIQFYNKTKGGVDCLDMMLGNYSCKRKNLRWTMVLFMFMLDVAAYNSFVLYKHRYGDIKRRHSLEKLAIDLMMPFIKIRIQKITENNFRGISRDIQDSFERIGVEMKKEEESNLESEEPKRKKTRCSDCPRSKDRKTNISCSSCEKFVCGEHYRTCLLCMSCMKEKSKAANEEKRQSAFFTLRNSN